MKKDKILTVIITILITLITAKLFLRSNDKESKIESPVAPATLPEKQKESKKIVIEYLDNVVATGSNGYDFWCESSRQFASSFYSPRSYQILSGEDDGNYASYLVRVNSSNNIGQPIINDLNLYMSKEQGNWCFTMLRVKQ